MQDYAKKSAEVFIEMKVEEMIAIVVQAKADSIIIDTVEVAKIFQSDNIVSSNLHTIADKL